MNKGKVVMHACGICFATVAVMSFLAPAVWAVEDNKRTIRRYADFSVCRGDTAVTFTIDTCCVASAFETRVALKGNERGQWGVRWYDCDGVRYDARVSRSDGDIIMDDPGVVVTVTREDSIITERRVTKGVATAGGYNTLAVENGEDNTRIYIGAEHLSCVASVDSSVLPEKFEFYSFGAVGIEYLVLEEEIPAWLDVMTEWDQEAMDRYMVSCKGYEGVWSYLDRDMNPTISRLGGRYRLMLVRGDDGELLLLYYDGAETNSRQWRPGMIKGRLRPSPFTGQYELEWYDAHFSRRNDESYATFDEAGQLLTLSFPLLKATVRLAADRFSRESPGM